MNRLAQGVASVRQAETEVRRLLTEAVEHSDFDGVIALTALARGLASILSNASGEPTSVEPSTQAPAEKGRRTVTAKPTVPNKKAARRGQYPRFVRDGEALVKFGWSKRAKAEYEHRAPKRVLMALADALQASGEGGKRFAMEGVLPIRDPDAGADAPTYQIYVSLAWMRQAGLVKQHGRQGYSIDSGTHLPTAVRTQWSAIPTIGSTS